MQAAGLKPSVACMRRRRGKGRHKARKRGGLRGGESGREGQKRKVRHEEDGEKKEGD